MFEEILKELFGTTKTFDDLLNEVFDDKTNTDDVRNDKNHSYFHSVNDTCKDCRHICHIEKESKDGEVIKDVNNSVSLEDKKNCTCNENVCKCDRKLYEKKETEYEALKGMNKHLEQSLKSAENALIEKDKKIAELESKLYEVTKDKEYLLNKFEQVKNVFSK